MNGAVFTPPVFYEFTARFQKPGEDLLREAGVETAEGEFDEDTITIDLATIEFFFPHIDTAWTIMKSGENSHSVKVKYPDVKKLMENHFGKIGDPAKTLKSIDLPIDLPF